MAAKEKTELAEQTKSLSNDKKKDFHKFNIKENCSECHNDSKTHGKL